MDSAGAAPPRKISVSTSSKEAAVTTAPSISSSSRRGRAVSTAVCHWSEYRIPRGVLLERVRSEKLPVVDQLVSQQQQQLPNDNDHQSTLNLLEQRQQQQQPQQQQQQQQHVVNPSHSSSSSSQLPKIEEQQKKKNSGRSQSYTQLLTYCTVCGSPGHLGYECNHGHILQRPVYYRESSSGVNASLGRRSSSRSSNNNNTQQHMTDVNSSLSSSSSSNEVHTKKDTGGGGHVEQNGITKDNRIISSKDSMSVAAAAAAATAMAVAAAAVTIQVGRVPRCATNLEGAATISGITGDDNSSIVCDHHDDQNTTNLLKTNNDPSLSPSSDFISTDPVAQSSATTPDSCGVVENLHNNNGLQGSHAAVTSDDDLSGDDNTIPVLHSSDAIPQVNVIQSSPPQNQPKPANPGGGVLRLKHPVAKQGAQVHFLLRSRATECLMSKPKIKEEEEDDEDMAIAATTASCHNLIPSSLSQLQQHQNRCFQQQPQLHDDYYYYYNNNSKDRVATVCGTVNGVLTTMLLDTGSSISAITKSFAQQLQLKTWMTGDFLVINQQQQQQQQQGFLNAETIEKYPECSCLVTLKIGDHEMSEVELNVLPAQMYNVTLGKNWLKHQKAICDYELDLLQLPSRLLSCC